VTTVVINGFFVGLVYALFAVGLVVVYRGSRVINFAYGETGMLGAFVFADLWVVHRSVPLVPALLLGVAASAVVGGATEWVVARPLRGESRITVMVGTFAIASLVLIYATRRWGLSPQFIEPLVGGQGPRIGGVRIQPQQLLILPVVGTLLAGLGLLYRYTSFGLRLRATALDPDAAAQVGVNINLTSLATWMLAGALAGISAILIAPLTAFHVYFMTGLSIRGVAAALVGGLTSLWGAVIAGISIGVAEAVIGYTSPVPGTVEVSVAAFIILLLLVRPQGLVRGAY
jgi:branched-chain amino acid transport system permease protein